MAFVGYFDRSIVPEFDLHLYISILRADPELQGALIGPMKLFTEPWGAPCGFLAILEQLCKHWMRWKELC